jgi:hypothetical protein
MSVRIAGSAPGSTFADSGDELLATADGDYLAHHWTRWPDRWDDRETLSRSEAVNWLVCNGFVDEALAHFADDEVHNAVAGARFYGIDSAIPRQSWERT